MTEETRKLVQAQVARILKHNHHGVTIECLFEYANNHLPSDQKIKKKDFGPILESLGWISGSTRFIGDQAFLVFYSDSANLIGSLKCVLFGHSVPLNSAFECQMAVFKGGLCSRCGKLVQGEFLGNCWTKEEKTEKGITLSGYDVSFATKQGFYVTRIR